MINDLAHCRICGNAFCVDDGLSETVCMQHTTAEAAVFDKPDQARDRNIALRKLVSAAIFCGVGAGGFAAAVYRFGKPDSLAIWAGTALTFCGIGWAAKWLFITFLTYYEERNQ